MGKRSDERRQQILAGMRKAVAERGYAGASVQEIARAASITPGLLHYHFASKEDALVALVEEMSRYLEERAAGGDLFALLDALTLPGDDEGERVRCWVAVGAEAMVRPEVRAVYGAAIAKVMGEMTLRLAGLVDETRIPEVAAALMSAVEGYFHLATACPEVVPPGSARRALHAMARGLVNP